MSPIELKRQKTFWIIKWLNVYVKSENLFANWIEETKNILFQVYVRFRKFSWKWFRKPNDISKDFFLNCSLWIDTCVLNLFSYFFFQVILCQTDDWAHSKSQDEKHLEELLHVYVKSENLVAYWIEETKNILNYQMVKCVRKI